MPFRFRCVFCRASLSIGRHKLGHDTTCPKCSRRIRVEPPLDQLQPIPTALIREAAESRPSPTIRVEG